MPANIDHKTVESFGDEWARFDQSTLDSNELKILFGGYFKAFPWQELPDNAVGFDMGCGSGRWAKLVAPRVGTLNCIDPADSALAVARRNLADRPNVNFIHAGVDNVPLPAGSQDFGYSLGVLHHIPDTAQAMASCVSLLKPGAPFLVYLYYRFDNRPAWFRLLWKLSELGRAAISNLPEGAKHLATDLIALTVYWPLARAAWLLEKLGLPVGWMPLSFYRASSFYTMRTDSRDRFGTPLEQRFTRVEVRAMMEAAGLRDIVIPESEPFWCAVGRKAG